MTKLGVTVPVKQCSKRSVQGPEKTKSETVEYLSKHSKLRAEFLIISTLTAPSPYLNMLHVKATILVAGLAMAVVQVQGNLPTIL